MNLLTLAITTAVLSCPALAGNKTQERLFRRATQGMHPVDVRFLCDHGCQVTEPTDREDAGPSRWTRAAFRCRNLDEELIPTVICDRHCVNPFSCKRMRRYVNRPVTFGVMATERKNDGITRTLIEVPVACRCEVRKPRKEKCPLSRRDNYSRT